MKTPKFDSIQPQFCINAKMRKLHRLINMAYQKKIRAFGLRGSMLSILFIIGKQTEIHQKTIAEMLVLDPSTMSRDLKKLMHQGLISIEKGQDPRYSNLKLTDAGKQLLEEISPVWEALQHKLQHILGDFDIQQIDELTKSVKENLNYLKE